MIKLYTWGTPNGKKVSIMLEEIGMSYEVYPINIGKNDQFKPEYLAINPNNKIPSIIDTEGPGGKPFTLFESGAILMYLAEVRQVLAVRPAAALFGDSVADVSNGRSRAHVRPGELFLPDRGKGTVRG
jgi:GST-like protein